MDVPRANPRKLEVRSFSLNRLFTAKRDTLFNSSTATPVEPPFRFNRDVAEVFDDMVTRSVPGYYDMQLLTAKLARKVCPPGSTIYDFGCSSGTSIAFIKRSVNFPLSFVGIDSSGEMLEQCKKKLEQLNLKESVDLRCSDILDAELTSPISLSIFNFTLQFLKPEDRLPLLKRVAQSTAPGGAVIISEKILSGSPRSQEVIQQLHWEFKGDAGYSELEIARKRDSLENVLIPFTAEENLDLIRAAGFKEAEVLYKNLNFAAFIGLA